MAGGDWRTLPVYVHGGPNGEGAWYNIPEYGDVEFTPPATDGSSGETIEVIRRRIMNQHPEDISALADQWQNAKNLMFSIYEQLLSQSDALYEQSWRSAEAREAFMEKGPGLALAYLREWMDAAQANVNALRQMVLLAQDSREEMESLWEQYQDEVEAASHASNWTEAKHGALWGLSLGFYDGERGVQAEEHEAVQAKHREFNGKAQVLAHNVGDQYFEQLSTLSAGHGPPFKPMNVVLNRVGHPPFPSLTGPTSPGPGPVAPGPPPAITAPDPMIGPPPALVGTVRMQGPTANLTPPIAPDPVPAAAVSPAAPPAVAPAPGLPPAVSAPSPVTRLSPNTGGLSSGLLQAPGLGPPPAQAPQGALRSPGAAAPPPPTGRRPHGAKQPPPGGGTLQRERPHLPTPAGIEEPFGGTPAPTTPPVLSGQRPTDRARPGSREELYPPRQSLGTTSPLKPAGTAPPVLNNPGSSALPPPTAAPPSRSGRGAPGGSSTSGATGRPAPSAEWVGAEQARADAATPVLGPPPPPPTRASRIEEAKLRRATAAPPDGVRLRPSGAVTSEVTSRRATPGTGVPKGPVGKRDRKRKNDEPGIVTDQEAFSVDTPGGGVVAKQAEDTSYRAEPPTALGG